MPAAAPSPAPTEPGRGGRLLRGAVVAGVLLAGATVSAIAIGVALRPGPAPRGPAGLAERPTHVTVELRGVPDGARVVDVRSRATVGTAPRVEVPYDPRGRIALEILIPGRAPMTLRLVPDRDQVITVAPP